jgi:hypothetical protein
MLNNKVPLEWARSFAAAALREKDPVRHAFRLAYSRQPDGWERDTVATFFHKQEAVIAARIANGEKIVAPPDLPPGIDPAHAAAFVDFCQMLLNSNEFVYRN